MKILHTLCSWQMVFNEYPVLNERIVHENVDGKNKMKFYKNEESGCIEIQQHKEFQTRD